MGGSNRRTHVLEVASLTTDTSFLTFEFLLELVNQLLRDQGPAVLETMDSNTIQRSSDLKRSVKVTKSFTLQCNLDELADSMSTILGLLVTKNFKRDKVDKVIGKVDHGADVGTLLLLLVPGLVKQFPGLDTLKDTELEVCQLTSNLKRGPIENATCWYVTQISIDKQLRGRSYRYLHLWTAWWRALW